MQHWKVDEAYVNPHCGLGEGPYYEAKTHTLRFVDIKEHRLHSVNLTEGPQSLKTLQLNTPISVTADIEGTDPSERLLAGLKHGIAVLDRSTGSYEYVTQVDEPPNQRTRGNDGAVDPNGRFWLGTMTDFNLGEFQPEGGLHLFDKKSPPQTIVPNVTIPNSICWSPDNKTMYFTSTTEGTVFAWDYDPSNGNFTNKRVFYKHEGTGGPDGCRVDVEGNLWHAVFGEGKVLKIAADESGKGKVVGEVKLPTPNITCPQFVGTELFCTSAQLEEGQTGYEDKAARELGGAVFRVDVGVKGCDPFEFRMA